MLGLPCAGKTSYLIDKKLKIIHVDNLSIITRCIGIFFVIVSSPILVSYVLQLYSFVSFINLKSHSKGVLRFFSRLYECSVLKKKDGILEEGLIQGLWALFINVELNDKSINILHKITTIICIKSCNIKYLPCPKTTIEKRNKERKKTTRFSLLIDNKSPEEVTRSRDWLAVIIRKIRREKINMSFLGYSRNIENDKLFTNN